jgi:hypothetical protein
MYSTRMNTSFQTALTLDAVRLIAPSAFAIQPHESRSSRYAYIPTSEIINGLDREGFRPFRAAQSVTRVAGKAEYTKHMIRFRHADAVAINGTYPEVILLNSHDGSSAYKLIAGLFRMVCTNGLISGDKVGEVAVHHKGNIVDNVIEGSMQVIGHARQALDAADSWSRLQLTAGEQHAFAAAAHELRFADADGKTSTPITPGQLLAPRRREDAATNLWTTLNVVQENVIRGGLQGVQHSTDDRGRRKRRNVTTREVKGIDQDVRLNRALWLLGQKMAELKA